MENKRVLFLYTEIAGYFLSCVKTLIQSGGVEVHLVRWPLNKEAPFDFRFPDSLQVYDRKSFSEEQLLALAKKINPDFIYCSGWVDKGYLKVCKAYKSRIPVVVGIDNQWDGSLRQRLASWFRFRLIKPYFNRAWVPGEMQKKFALQLGFQAEDIYKGFYSADTDHFFRFYEMFGDKKKAVFPRRFIYVGRYLPFKGVVEMWDAFAELQDENPSDWELWCLGTGDLWEKRREHEKIKHFGFVQPGEIEKFVADTGVFILPSTFEPWGVVVHEFAASGFPLICTDKVGAAGLFVHEGENGWIVPASDKQALKTAMRNMMQCSDERLNQMADASHRIAREVTPQKWVHTLQSILNEKM